MLVINNIPTEYRSQLFRKIAERVQPFHVVYLSADESVRQKRGAGRDEERFATVLRPILQVRNRWTTTSDLIFGRIPLRVLRGHKVVVSFGYGYLSIVSFMFMARVLGKRTALFFESTRADKTRRRLVDLLKSVMIRAIYTSFFVPGELSRKYLIELGVPPSRVMVAPNGIDIADVPKRVRQRRSHGDPLRVGMVGRLAPEKRFEWAAEVLLTRTSVTIEIAGEGAGRSTLRSLDGGERLKLLGHLRGEELERFFHEIDVLVLPSTSETWGFVVNEAMARGCPVIVSDRAGSSAVVDQVAGCVFAAMEAEALISALHKVEQNIEGYSMGALELSTRMTADAQARIFADALTSFER